MLSSRRKFAIWSLLCFSDFSYICVRQAFCYCKKHLRESFQRRSYMLRLMISEVLLIVNWLYCFGPKVRQNSVQGTRTGIKLFASCQPGSRGTNGLRTKHILQRCISSDLLSSTGSYLQMCTSPPNNAITSLLCQWTKQ